MLLIPALVGKAEFIRFFFGADIWIFFNQVCFGIFMLNPLTSILYYLSYSNVLETDYQNMFYLFCGNAAFTFMFLFFFYTFIDRPFYAITYLKGDIHEANLNYD
jgi:hypothetical protein